MTAAQAQDAPFQQSTQAGRSKGQASNRALSARSKIAQTLDIQRVVIADINNPATKPSDRAQLVRAYDVLEERLRILRNRVKPGSRNISVREGIIATTPQRQRPQRNLIVDVTPNAPAPIDVPPTQPPEPRS